jgi:hypothetical protein
MSSIHRAPSVTKQGNDYFVNLITLAAGNTYSYDESTGAVTANGAMPAGFTTAAISNMLVKDMGKTVRYNGAVYRKVQANTLAGASSSQDFTTYIQLNNGSDNNCDWARVTIQA